VAIANMPKKRTSNNEPKAKDFIAGAVKFVEDDLGTKPIQIRIRPGHLQMIDQAARRRGLSRSAFLVSSAIKEVESMG
jgi:Protein of unknown function (DUF1778)